MLIETYCLRDEALNFAIAEAIGADYLIGSIQSSYLINSDFCEKIIKENNIRLRNHKPYPEWGASKKKESGDAPSSHKGDCFAGFGPTKYISAMRCFCISKLGESIEIPDYLLTEDQKSDYEQIQARFRSSN